MVTKRTLRWLKVEAGIARDLAVAVAIRAAQKVLGWLRGEMP